MKVSQGRLRISRLQHQAMPQRCGARPLRCGARPLRITRASSQIVSQLTHILSDQVIRRRNKPLSSQNGALMKIVLIGANGTIGELVQKALAGAGPEIVKGGRKSGGF